MKDDIKEILEEMKSIIDTGKDRNGIKVDGYGFHGKDLKLLYDCITNLQQEIKEANDSITWWTNRFKAVERDNKELKEELEEEKRIEEADLKTIQQLEEENETRQQDINNLTYQLAKMKEENERLKEEIDRQSKAQVILDDMLADYNYRIDRAIEYIQNNMQYDNNIDDNWVMTDDLLNILQNGSDENTNN